MVAWRIVVDGNAHSELLKELKVDCNTPNCIFNQYLQQDSEQDLRSQ